jgi:penicillin-binding protein 1A
MGVLFGALTIGAVFYAYSRDLPSHESLAQYTPPTISRIYSGEGQMIDEFAKERRLFVPIEDIPELVTHAFVSAEDKNFYTHHGYDAEGMLGALRDAVTSRGRNVRGASTITQQVMKNFLLSGDRKVGRKIQEIILATRLEQTLTKDKILELYLNEIFLGQNSYGVAAAAQTYFNKTLDELTPGEAAYLATLPKAPSDLHPVRNREKALDRRAYVLGRMAEDGYITPEVADAERDKPLLTVQGGEVPAFRDSMPSRDYFTDEIRRQLSGTFGEEEFFGGGLTIRATVDEELQAAAAKALRRGLEKYDRGLGRWRGTGQTIAVDRLGSEDDWRAALTEVVVPRDIDGWYPAVVIQVGEDAMQIGIESVQETAEQPFVIPRSDIDWMRGSFAENFKPGDVIHVRRVTNDEDDSFVNWSARQVPEVQGAFMAMDVNTGRVYAMQGGFSYQYSVFNRATQATRQPGSSFKPFVYAAALDSGFSPATIVVDAPIEVNTPQGLWKPQNASDKYYGPTTIRNALEQSRNLVTVRIAQEIGMETVAGYAERFGVYDPMNPFLANALGAQETTLFKMVAAYAMFANGGERVEPTLVDRVQDRFGATIYRHDQRVCEDCTAAELPGGAAPEVTSNRERVMDAITAYQLTSMLQGVVQRGTARGINLPVPIAGKTGTTNEAKDVWFVGFSSNMVAGCYIGFDQPKTMGDSATGGGLCGPVFESFMNVAIKKYGGTDFAVPPGGYFVNIDRFTGARLGDGARGDNVVAEYFREGEDPLIGLGTIVDGGFGMGSNLPLFAYGETDGGGASNTVTNASGRSVVVPRKADFGTVSSGGLY